MRPHIAFNRSCISQKRREHGPLKLIAKAESFFCFAYFFYFFGNSATRFPEKHIRGRRLRNKTGLRRFWRWSSRESAWPISKLILAMGGTLGPAPKAMQLSRPSLLSYLQRFNKKRRVHYKIDVQPRWRSDGPGPRLRKDRESETAKEASRA